MAKPRIRWNYRGFGQVRTLPKVMAMLTDEAESRAQSAGEGYIAKPADVTGGRVRGRAAVLAATGPARRREAREHNLAR